MGKFDWKQFDAAVAGYYDQQQRMIDNNLNVQEADRRARGDQQQFEANVKEADRRARGDDFRQSMDLVREKRYQKQFEANMQKLDDERNAIEQKQAVIEQNRPQLTQPEYEKLTNEMTEGQSAIFDMQVKGIGAMYDMGNVDEALRWRQTMFDRMSKNAGPPSRSEMAKWYEATFSSNMANLNKELARHESMAKSQEDGPFSPYDPRYSGHKAYAALIDQKTSLEQEHHMNMANSWAGQIPDMMQSTDAGAGWMSPMAPDQQQQPGGQQGMVDPQQAGQFLQQRAAELSQAIGMDEQQSAILQAIVRYPLFYKIMPKTDGEKFDPQNRDHLQAFMTLRDVILPDVFPDLHNAPTDNLDKTRRMQLTQMIELSLEAAGYDTTVLMEQQERPNSQGASQGNGRANTSRSTGGGQQPSTTRGATQRTYTLPATGATRHP